MGKFDLVSSLHALPEAAPVEIEGIQFGGGTSTCSGNGTSCLVVLTISLTVVAQTICVLGTVCQ